MLAMQKVIMRNGPKVHLRPRVPASADDFEQTARLKHPSWCKCWSRQANCLNLANSLFERAFQCIHENNTSTPAERT